MKKLEICCGNVEDVMIASQFKIDSIELNCALELGGLTPSLSTLKLCKEITTIPLYCMVRPVPGGFCYSEVEFKTMLLEAKDLLENGADGIVFGILSDELSLDIPRIRQMIELANKYHKEAIFHRAFDLIENQESAYQTLIELGIDRVLTSGGQPQTIDGLSVIQKLIEIDSNKIIVGSGINPNNVHKFKDVPYLHATCKELKFRLNGNEWVNYDVSQPNMTYGVSKECVASLLSQIKKEA